MKQNVPLWLLLLFFGLGLLAYFTKPDPSKKILKDAIEKQQVELLISKNRYDSLENIRIIELSNYDKSIKDKNKELNEINKRLDSKIKNRYDYEKASNTYFKHDFNKRFDVLTANVRKDSLER